MQHLKNLWLSLDTRKQIIAILGGLAVMATLFAIYQVATKPGMSLLYSGLEDRASGDVIQALEAKAVAYEIRGDSIFVRYVAARCASHEPRQRGAAGHYQHGL